ncbi:MAG: ferrochelatase [Thermoanaerobaculia bacterium]
MEWRDLYLSRPGANHDEAPRGGILVANLGTPDAPTARALRPYLRQFLSDPRVIERPRWQWLPILYLFVLTARPRRSARLYTNIWTEEGSPLLVHTERIASGIRQRLEARSRTPPAVEVGMRYGNPSIAAALRRLADAGCERLLVLPLFPQYFAGTTGSALDAVFQELVCWRSIPELRVVGHYHDEPGYLHALAASLHEAWGDEGPAERVLFSFHGVPERYVENGDPYLAHCQATGQRLADELGLPRERWQVTFQSLFGRERWLEPYTDLTLQELARSGIESVDVICPGFAADCLETLDEVGREAQHSYLGAGGRRFRYVPCLNDRPDHLDFLTGLAARHLGDWLDGQPARESGAPRGPSHASGSPVP